MYTTRWQCGTLMSTTQNHTILVLNPVTYSNSLRIVGCNWKTSRICHDKWCCLKDMSWQMMLPQGYAMTNDAASRICYGKWCCLKDMSWQTMLPQGYAMTNEGYAMTNDAASRICHDKWCCLKDMSWQMMLPQDLVHFYHDWTLLSFRLKFIPNPVYLRGLWIYFLLCQMSAGVWRRSQEKSSRVPEELLETWSVRTQCK